MSGGAVCLYASQYSSKHPEIWLWRAWLWKSAFVSWHACTQTPDTISLIKSLFLSIIWLQTFLRRQHLEDHLRVHSGDRPYKCTRCGQRWLNVFVCFFCVCMCHFFQILEVMYSYAHAPFWSSQFSRFTHSHHLKRHLKYHQNDKPHACMVPDCEVSCLVQRSISSKHTKQLIWMQFRLDFANWSSWKRTFLNTHPTKNYGALMAVDRSDFLYYLCS